MDKRDFMKAMAVGAAMAPIVMLDKCTDTGNGDVSVANKESAYDRVMRTGVLRCGYIPYSYFFAVDPNTKSMSGVNYDIVNEIGRLMNIKIEWAEELTWATVTPSLQSGRIDAFCSGMWIDTQNGKFIAFTDSVFYNSVGAYVRADETRFKTMDDLNNANVRVAARDGGTPEIIARQSFPKARVVSNPSGISDGEMIEQLISGKADVIFYGDDVMADVMSKRPGVLKALLPDEKLRVYATAYGFSLDDMKLKTVFDNAITELKGSGFIETTLKKYALEGSWLKSLLQ